MLSQGFVCNRTVKLHIYEPKPGLFKNAAPNSGGIRFPPDCLACVLLLLLSGRFKRTFVHLHPALIR